MLLAGLAATYGVFLLTSMRIAIKVREVTVPDVRGQAVDTASQTLEDLGLTVVLDPLRRRDAVVPADHIWAQDPVAGTVIRRQRPVRIRVSDGMQAAAVPAVIGESERSAQILLAQDRISLTQTSDINSADYAPGVVVAQDPPAKSQAPGVALLVNRGEDGLTYVMPDLIGTYGARAAEILRRRLFRVTIVCEGPYPDPLPATVGRYSPQAGNQLAPCVRCTLGISR